MFSIKELHLHTFVLLGIEMTIHYLFVSKSEVEARVSKLSNVLGVVENSDTTSELANHILKHNKEEVALHTCLARYLSNTGQELSCIIYDS